LDLTIAIQGFPLCPCLSIGRYHQHSIDVLDDRMQARACLRARVG
jgi:hypothetical protein